MCRADSRFAPSQWETAFLCNDVFHWLGANLKSALSVFYVMLSVARFFICDTTTLKYITIFDLLFDYRLNLYRLEYANGDLRFWRQQLDRHRQYAYSKLRRTAVIWRRRSATKGRRNISRPLHNAYMCALGYTCIIVCGFIWIFMYIRYVFIKLYRKGTYWWNPISYTIDREYGRA